MTVHRYRRHVMMLTAALALLGTVQCMAQRFQYAYGSPNCVDAGRCGVTQLRSGGYVAVGQSEGLAATCGASQIYVVRTGPSGALVWSNIYTIGSVDSALDVIECCNGDIAICGVTQDVPACNTGRDAFVLRLSSAGAVVSVQTYGLASTDEIAWNLVEARSGDGITTNAGDLIVVGSTTDNAGAGRDGWIFRVTSALAPIWSEHYGLTASRDDYLYGVYECRVNVPTGTAGDIVATGGTNTWGAGGYDIWVLRVDGNNGNLGLAPRTSATYGRAQNDEGRAIIELRFGQTPGQLVVTGISNSRLLPSTNSEVAMLQTAANPCLFVAGRYAGDNGTGADGGLDLKEDAFPSVLGGDVIVTGYTALGNVAGGITPPNVFLQKFQCGSMVPVGGAVAYGGLGIDWGWSVNNCTRHTFCNTAAETEGYVVAGFTQSINLIGAADPQQLYLIKTDLALSSNCNEVSFLFNNAPPLWPQTCPVPSHSSFSPSCTPTVSTTPVTWATLLCYSPFGAQQGGGGGNDGASNVAAPPTIPLGDGTVTTYPNPVLVGVPLNLRLSVRKASQADITVSDVAGHVVYRTTMMISPGSGPVTIDTDKWIQGAYIVRVDFGTSASTARVILTE